MVTAPKALCVHTPNMNPCIVCAQRGHELHVRVRLCVLREDFVLDNVEQESQAQALLEQTISLLQSIAQQNASVVDRMKLMQISRNMVGGAASVRD